jgi:acetate kinase
MNILAINCGGTSVKFLVSAAGDGSAQPGSLGWLARGRVEGLGRDAVLLAQTAGGASVEKKVRPPDVETAVREIIAWCRESELALDAAGYLLPRGGERFARSILVDEGVNASLESLEDQSPRQDGAGLAGLREARAGLGRGTPLVAVFDDAFHVTMPERACLYALPREDGRRLTIRRHGSHGVSYRYLVERYSHLTGTPVESTTLVAFHLDGSCSAAAIAGGRSIDTSSEWSALLGPSGGSHELRELVVRESSGPAARLAFDLFIYRARKYLGAYLAALGGADAVVFSGGIGENLPSVRQRICEGAEWCGLLLDSAANRRAVGVEAEIGTRGSRMRVFVIPTDEEGMIARETAACLQAAGRGGAARTG